MIPETTYLFTGFVAVLASAGAMRAGYDAQTRSILAVAAMSWWAIFAYGSLTVAVSDGAGGFETFRLMSHTLLGVVNGIIMLLVAVDKVRDQSPAPDDRRVMQ